jgi:hypothetical protein
MMGRLIPVAAFTALLLGACSETPTETANDVAEAREDAAEDINETRKDTNETINDAERDIADAQQHRQGKV